MPVAKGKKASISHLSGHSSGQQHVGACGLLAKCFDLTGLIRKKFDDILHGAVPEPEVYDLGGDVP